MSYQSWEPIGPAIKAAVENMTEHERFLWRMRRECPELFGIKPWPRWDALP